MTSSRGLLENWAILMGMLLFCLYESITLWLIVTKYDRFPHDAVRIFGLAFAAFVTASIARRSTFSADRVVFVAITVVSVLTAVRMAYLTSLAMLLVKVAEASMWTIAATVCLVVLLRGFKTSVRGN